MDSGYFEALQSFDHAKLQHFHGKIRTFEDAQSLDQAMGQEGFNSQKAELNHFYSTIAGSIKLLKNEIDKLDKKIKKYPEVKRLLKQKEVYEIILRKYESFHHKLKTYYNDGHLAFEERNFFSKFYKEFHDFIVQKHTVLQIDFSSIEQETLEKIELFIRNFGDAEIASSSTNLNSKFLHRSSNDENKPALILNNAILKKTFFSLIFVGLVSYATYRYKQNEKAKEEKKS